MVLYLVWAELYRIHSICLWCTAVHVVTFLLWIVVLFGQILSTPAPAAERADEFVDELSMTTDIGGTEIVITPKVVDAGHHSRRLLRLTGLDVGENQARRLLNDLDAYTAATDRQGDDEEIVAHDWLAKVYEPTTRAVPRELTGRLEPAEIFHEVLEHRWYMSERAGHDTPLEDALRDYVATVLPAKPEEKAVLGVDTEEMPVISRFD
jgi:hypothetical protein